MPVGGIKSANLEKLPLAEFRRCVGRSMAHNSPYMNLHARFFFEGMAKLRTLDALHGQPPLCSMRFFVGSWYLGTSRLESCAFWLALAFFWICDHPLDIGIGEDPLDHERVQRRAKQVHCLTVSIENKIEWRGPH